jgi:hypothetical protein
LPLLPEELLLLDPKLPPDEEALDGFESSLRDDIPEESEPPELRELPTESEDRLCEEESPDREELMLDLDEEELTCEDSSLEWELPLEPFDELDSLTDENDLLDPKQLSIGVGTPDKSLVGLELGPGTIGEAVAGKTLANSGQTDRNLHRLRVILFRKPQTDVVALHDRADGDRDVRHASANL